MIGKEFKHYRVEQTLGKGGMGEVYRALLQGSGLLYVRGDVPDSET